MDVLKRASELLGMEAPPVTEREWSRIMLSFYTQRLDGTLHEGPLLRFGEQGMALEKSIQDAVGGGGFLLPETGVVLFTVDGQSVRLKDVYSKCRAADPPFNVATSMVDAVIDYRQATEGLTVEDGARIEVGKDGQRLSYIPKSLDAVSQTMYDAINTIEIYDDTSEGLLLADAVNTSIRPLSIPPSKTGKIQKDRWKGLSVAHDVEGIGADVRVGEQSLVIRNPLDMLQRVIGSDKFDARVKASADLENIGYLAMAVPRRVVLTGAQMLAYLGEATDTNEWRWTKANIERVDNAFWGIRSAAIRSPNPKFPALLPVFHAELNDGTVSQPDRGALYTIGRAEWLERLRLSKDAGGVGGAAMRVTGGLYWRVSSARRGSHATLSPLAMRFLSTAERIVANSAPIPLPYGKGSKVPMLLHPDNDDWIEIGFDDWCNKLARIDYDPNIRPTGNNTVQAKLIRALEKAVVYTQTHPTTIEFDYGTGFSEGKRGARLRLKFRASPAFREFHAKPQKHENMLTQIPLREFFKRLE